MVEEAQRDEALLMAVVERDEGVDRRNDVLEGGAVAEHRAILVDRQRSVLRVAEVHLHGDDISLRALAQLGALHLAAVVQRALVSAEQPRPLALGEGELWQLLGLLASEAEREGFVVLSVDEDVVLERVHTAREAHVTKGESVVLHLRLLGLEDPVLRDAHAALERGGGLGRKANHVRRLWSELARGSARLQGEAAAVEAGQLGSDGLLLLAVAVLLRPAADDDRGSPQRDDAVASKGSLAGDVEEEANPLLRAEACAERLRDEASVEEVEEDASCGALLLDEGREKSTDEVLDVVERREVQALRMEAGGAQQCVERAHAGREDGLPPVGELCQAHPEHGVEHLLEDAVRHEHVDVRSRVPVGEAVEDRQEVALCASDAARGRHGLANGKCELVAGGE
mmetsp:Transcript_1318/g.4739  ORF Transcript_1318/g.4739 Transcript_1318/m.4739 type:complete len:398 (-) Transcript_1318:522-1715(-)